MAQPDNEKSLRHSIKDATAYAVMMGIGETYLSAFALFLSWWVDLRRFPPSAFLSEEDGGEPFTPTNASRLD